MSKNFRHVKTIAVDFDGVVHSYEKGWNGGSIYGTLKEDCKEVIDGLKAKGFNVVIFTARENLDDVREWLIKMDLELEVTNTKPPAIAYIDDRAIRFTNWKDMANYFS
jgi:hydroxymethylpyrimidine pyrophosphatase-like HAD family hydrolase